MSTTTLSEQELRQKGLEVLERELGYLDMIRFLQILHPGKGDYTAERHEWLDKIDFKTKIEEILNERTKAAG